MNSAGLKALLLVAYLTAVTLAPVAFVLGFLFGAVLFVAFHVALFHFSKPLFKAVFSAFVEHFDIMKDGDLYLRRYYLTPRVPWMRRYFLHNILRSDNDRDPHDHPWPFETRILAGCYIEHIWYPGFDVDPAGPQFASEESGALYHVDGRQFARIAWEGSHHSVSAFHTHKVEIIEECWTLFCTGPAQREWGFWKLDPTDSSKDVWIEHSAYLAMGDHGEEVRTGS